MNYFEHNDTKGRDARRAVELNKAERAAMREPFDGTLFMNKWDLQARRCEAAFNAELTRFLQACNA